MLNKIYKVMYGQFKGKGGLKNLIFNIWYQLEWLRVDLKEFITK